MINHAKLKQSVWFLGDPNYLDCGFKLKYK